MMATEFPKFRDLPMELRVKIWSFCVPGPRVYEMDYPLSDFHSTFPDGEARPRELWSSKSGLWPVISRVCREARDVALNRHRHRYMYVTGEEGQTDEHGVPYPPWTAWNANLPVRFRKGFDIVHLHWHGDYDHHDWLGPPPNPLPSFQWLASQAAAASVSAELLHRFDPDGDKNYSLASAIGSKNAKYFDPHVLYYVVLAIVEIHISAEEAAHAGVFGTLGEEPIRLVDPRDTATVARFQDAWRCGRASLEEPDVAEFFSRVTDAADDYCARVEQWRQELEKKWMWHKCNELRVPEDTHAKIWSDLDQPRELRFDWSRRQLDKGHPWVQKQLAVMPRFEPVLMFRHCTGRCGLAGYANP